MNRPGALAVVLLALGMAGGTCAGRPLAAAVGTLISAPLPANALLVPAPGPGPVFSAEGFLPAPVPDPDLQRPTDRAADGTHAAVVPHLGSPVERRDGQGFVQGSAAQYDPDRHLRASPSISLRVPLQ